MGISKAWPAPAKINLFLHITGQRADGYHELQTVFQFLDFSDHLTFTIIPEKTIERLTPLADIAAERDLMIQAAKSLQDYTGCDLGVKIAIEKQIPIGGGVGGGSSNAATTLVALNRLWGLDIKTEELCEIGLALGADVPVFIHGHASFAEGVGDQFRPIEPQQPYYIILRPNVSISTREIFTHPELTRNTPPITIRDFLGGAGHNDCEALTRKLYPEVDQALNWLNQFSTARLTGTGSCIFAPFVSKEQAAQVFAKRPDNTNGFVCQGRNVSPLMQRLNDEQKIIIN